MPDISSHACLCKYKTHTHSGAALIVSLLMLVIILLLGISATQITLQGERASRNDRDRQVAFQAAEAVLIDAEMDLMGSRHNHIFPKDSKVGFEAKCIESGDYMGLCQAARNGMRPLWETVDFMQEKPSVPYGKFTGKTFQTGTGLLPARAPRYIIEVLPFVKEGQTLDSTLYRITGIGFGMRPTTQVVLQSIYRKE